MSKMSDMSDLLRGRIRPRFVKYDSKSASVGAAEGSEGFDSLLASLAPRFLDNDPPKVGSSHGAHYSKIRLDQQHRTCPVFEVSHWTLIARETNTKSGTV